ncbi:Uncharacterised protein [Vibrio cholerae]|nr:Uncharacterised protein [Vibrio cholerae]
MISALVSIVSWLASTYARKRFCAFLLSNSGLSWIDFSIS